MGIHLAISNKYIWYLTLSAAWWSRQVGTLHFEKVHFSIFRCNIHFNLKKCCAVLKLLHAWLSSETSSSLHYCTSKMHYSSTFREPAGQHSLNQTLSNKYTTGCARMHYEYVHKPRNHQTLLHYEWLYCGAELHYEQVVVPTVLWLHCIADGFSWS